MRYTMCECMVFNKHEAMNVKIRIRYIILKVFIKMFKNKIRFSYYFFELIKLNN